MYMFALNYNLSNSPVHIRTQPILSVSTQPQPDLPPSVSFGFRQLRNIRPKAMYIDMNAGKGCSSCGIKYYGITYQYALVFVYK
jgi:hypothetical protein